MSKKEELEVVTLPPGYFGPIRVQLGSEPPAVLNLGGGKIPEDHSKIPLVKKGWVSPKKKAK